MGVGLAGMAVTVGFKVNVWVAVGSCALLNREIPGKKMTNPITIPAITSKNRPREIPAGFFPAGDVAF